LRTTNLFRVVGAALALSTLSFAAGVAGDLSLADGPTHGARVVLRIPPELPEDTPRAAPIALISTASAEAREERPAVRRRIAHAPRLEKPPHEQALAAAPKEDLDLAPKDDGRKEG
jgi:hypothetical protein